MPRTIQIPTYLKIEGVAYNDSIFSVGVDVEFLYSRAFLKDDDHGAPVDDRPFTNFIRKSFMHDDATYMREVYQGDRIRLTISAFGALAILPGDHVKIEGVSNMGYSFAATYRCASAKIDYSRQATYELVSLNPVWQKETRENFDALLSQYPWPLTTPPPIDQNADPPPDLT